MYDSAENGPVALEVTMPEPVADDRRQRLGNVAVFLASERAAEDRLYPQDIEIVSGDKFDPCGRGVLSVADGGGSLLIERQSGDASEVGLEVPGVGIRNTRSFDAARTDRFEDGELSVIRSPAVWVQHHPVDPAKDCRGGGNTDRQGKHCDGCPGRGSTEDTGCVTEVFEDAAHRVPALKSNWASDFKCLILFKTAGESVLISGAGCPKMGSQCASARRRSWPAPLFYTGVPE